MDMEHNASSIPTKRKIWAMSSFLSDKAMMEVMMLREAVRKKMLKNSVKI